MPTLQQPEVLAYQPFKGITHYGQWLKCDGCLGHGYHEFYHQTQLGTDLTELTYTILLVLHYCSKVTINHIVSSIKQGSASMSSMVTTLTESVTPRVT